MATRDDILRFCADYLAVDQFRDTAINGLQVEGSPTIRRMATAVSANAATIAGAVAQGADTLLVHHGLLWGERLSPITGPLRDRLRLLLANDLNLIGYHLPLDAHPEVGNNALLAQALGLTVVQPFAMVHGRAIGVIGEPEDSLPLDGLVLAIARITGFEPLVLDAGPAEVRRVAVVSGSGYSALDEAAAAGCDVLLTGDVREPTMALARELGVTVIAAGHEATERMGVQALASRLSQTFGIETTFVSDPNPV